MPSTSRKTSARNAAPKTARAGSKTAPKKAGKPAAKAAGKGVAKSTKTAAPAKASAKKKAPAAGPKTAPAPKAASAASKAPPSKAPPSKAPPSKAPPSKAPQPAPAAPDAKAAAPATRPSRVPPRLTVRTPEGADALKQKLSALATTVGQIRSLKRSIGKSFLDVGDLLIAIRDQRLYEVKGYGSFESFLEREIELGKQLGMRCVRAVEIFHRDAALAAGLDRVTAAIAILDGEVEPSAAPPATSPSTSGSLRSPIPFHKL